MNKAKEHFDNFKTNLVSDDVIKNMNQWCIGLSVLFLIASFIAVFWDINKVTYSFSNLIPILISLVYFISSTLLIIYIVLNKSNKKIIY